jgi:hypothetical protein
MEQWRPTRTEEELDKRYLLQKAPSFNGKDAYYSNRSHR